MKKLERFSTPQTVQLSELLNPSFMAAHTSFPTFEDMLEASPWDPATADEFRALPDAEWDAYVSSVTHFSSWKAMQQRAATEWMAKQIRSS